MAYYLGRYAGAGSGFLDPFRPDLPAGPFASIDLRPDPTVVDGNCLLWTPASVPNPLLRGLIELGDDPTETIPFLARQRLENQLGITLDRDGTIGELASQVLLNHAREDGTRWRALRFQRHQRTDPVSGFLALYRAIYLGAPGARVWEQYVLGGPGTVFTETWPGANNDSPDGDQDWTETLSDWDVVGNELHLITASEGAVRAEVDLASDDHYAEATYVGGSSPGSFPAVCCRFAAAASTYYIGYIESASGTQDTFIYKYIAGTPTAIQTSTGEGLANSDVIRMEVDGSDLDLMRNGVSTLTGTDTSITGNVRVGLGGFNAGASQIQFDNFEGGDLSAIDDNSGFRMLENGTDFRVLEDGTTRRILEGADPEISGGSQADITVDASGAGTKDASGGGQGDVTVDASGAGSTQRSGGGQGDVTVDASGAGTKQGQGGGQGDVQVDASGAGTTDRSGGSQADIAVDATGAGGKAVEGGSQADVEVNATAAGFKDGQGGSQADVEVNASGGGTADRTGGSQADVEVNASGAGTKAVDGGSQADIEVSADGNGEAGLEGGSQANITVSSDGAGDKQTFGGSEAVIEVIATGGGTPASGGEGGSQANVTVTATGDGTKATDDGSQANITVDAQGAGAKDVEGGSTAIITVHATGGTFPPPNPPRLASGSWKGKEAILNACHWANH